MRTLRLRRFKFWSSPILKCSSRSTCLCWAKTTSLIYIYAVADQSGVLAAAAVNRVPTESDETARKSLILLLWYAQAEAADKPIATLAADSTRSSAVRDYAQQIMHAKDK